MALRARSFPDREARGSYCWSLDPVDGTRSFTCGLPTWVTLIALLRDGLPVLSVIDAPCLGERYIGDRGRTLMVAAASEHALATSPCKRLGEARLSTTDPYLFVGAEKEAFERVRRSVRTTRYGQDGYAYARLAAGTIDLVIESGLKPHDYNALIPVVRGAGGLIGDWRGGEDFSRARSSPPRQGHRRRDARAVRRSAGPDGAMSPGGCGLTAGVPAAEDGDDILPAEAARLHQHGKVVDEVGRLLGAAVRIAGHGGERHLDAFFADFLCDPGGPCPRSRTV